MDPQKYLYVSDLENHEIRRYTIRDKNGIFVVGGIGQGNQFNYPSYLFVDKEQDVYVSDSNNHRVIKWDKGEKACILAAG